jgi:ABC-type transporter Mla subunit MlaD
MEERKQSVMVGLFMLAGLACLAILLFWFAEAPGLFGQRSYPLEMHFDELQGIQEGSEVRMAIGRVGVVKKMRFADPANPGQGVIVVADIDWNVGIPVNTLAVAHPVAMGFGRGEIRLHPPLSVTGTVPRDGTGRITGRLAGPLDTVIQPEVVDTLQKAADAIARFADALTPVARDLDELFRPRSLESVDRPPPGGEALMANLSTVVQRFDTVLKHVNTVIGDPVTKSQIREAIANLHQMSEDGKVTFHDLKEFSGELNVGVGEARTLVADMGASVDRTEQRVAGLLRSATDDLDSLGRVLNNLEIASAALAAGDGTAGRMLRDPKLYEEMLLTFQRLTVTVDQLKAVLEQWEEKGVKMRNF